MTNQRQSINVIYSDIDVIYFDFDEYKINEDSIKKGKGIQIEYSFSRQDESKISPKSVKTVENNPIIIVESEDKLEEYLSLIGECEYVFRKGVGYVGEVYRLKYKHKTENNKHVFTLFKKEGNKLEESNSTLELEEKELQFIYPLVLAPDLTEKGFSWSRHYVIFPYHYGSKEPIEREDFEKEAPNLYQYLCKHKDRIQKQSLYNDRIQKRKEEEFYGLIRVGEYSYGEYFVALRDNTKLTPCYVGTIETDWGVKKQPIFDGHISYVRVSSEEEAKHIVNALENQEVKELISILYDNRSISLRLPIRIKKFRLGEENGGKNSEKNMGKFK